MTRFIFITGGVVSSLGKGLASASLGALLQARGYKYNKFASKSNSTWMSRNMIITGLVILAFIIVHFIDFWIPEINYKYIEFIKENPNRYYEELIHKFANPLRVYFYCISFLLLALHLLHGFKSSIKSFGFNNNYIHSLRWSGYIFSVGVPLGFCFIALYHHLAH